MDDRLEDEEGGWGPFTKESALPAKAGLKRIGKYCLLNMPISLIAGTAAGYSLEKTGVPSGNEIEIQLNAGFQLASSGIEYAVNNNIRKIAPYIYEIGLSNSFSIPFFQAGTYVGRVLAKVF